VSGLAGEEAIGLAETLLDIERELAGGGGSAYRRRLCEDAIVIVPGRALDKRATVAAMDASPGWDAFWMEESRSLRLGAGAAMLTYRFHGRRADLDYEAILSSTYVKDPSGAWKLAFHQQTPIVPG